MKRKQIIDLLIIVFVFLGLSCFPFKALIRNNDYLVYSLSLVCNVIISLFLFFFIWKGSSIKFKRHEEKNRISLTLIPTFLMCFSSYFYIIFYPTFTSNFSNIFFLQIFLSLVCAFNEVIVFTGIIQSNLPFKHTLFKVLLIGGLFAIYQFSHYLFSFDVNDILSIASGFGLGIVVGFMYEYGRNRIECVTFVFFFNVFNVYLFKSFVYVEHYWLLVVIKIVIAFLIILYLIILYFSYYRKEENTENPIKDD